MLVVHCSSISSVLQLPSEVHTAQQALVGLDAQGTCSWAPTSGYGGVLS